jgi:ribosomal protein S27AE
MSMSAYLWRGSISQRTSTGANNAAMSANERAADAVDQVERLTLITMALWKLLQEHTDLTEADLLAKVTEIDLADGVADGKITRTTVAKCPKCSRSMSPKHKRCLYCGESDLVQSAFDSLG